MAAVKRAVRVAERAREILSVLLQTEVRDPRLEGVAITDIEMTADLQNARVRVRSTRGDDPASRKALFEGLRSATGLLRRELARRLSLRYAPALRFEHDDAPEKRDRIDALLLEIERERREREGRE